jgi:hypothetical protein
LKAPDNKLPYLEYQLQQSNLKTQEAAPKDALNKKATIGLIGA